MPDPVGQRPAHARRSAQKRSGSPSPVKRGDLVRDRLRRDPFLFILCLAALGSITWAFALTWWVTGAAIALAVALASIAPAVFLFYLRDAGRS
jgi:hypothetical protein